MNRIISRAGSDYVGAQYSETVRIYLNFDQQIDASEISFEDVIIVEKKKNCHI